MLKDRTPLATMNRYYSLIQKKGCSKIRNTKKTQKVKYGLEIEQQSNFTNNISYMSPLNTPISSKTMNYGNMDNQDFFYNPYNGDDTFDEHLSFPDYAEYRDTNNQRILSLSKHTDDSISHLTNTPERYLDCSSHLSVNTEFVLETKERYNPGYFLTKSGKILTQVKSHPYLYYDPSHPDMVNLIKESNSSNNLNA